MSFRPSQIESNAVLKFDGAPNRAIHIGRDILRRVADQREVLSLLEINHSFVQGIDARLESGDFFTSGVFKPFCPGVTNVGSINITDEAERELPSQIGAKDLMSAGAQTVCLSVRRPTGS